MWYNCLLCTQSAIEWAQFQLGSSDFDNVCSFEHVICETAVQAESRINNMLKMAKIRLIHACSVKSESFDGTLYIENTGNTFLAIVEILMESINFFIHHDIIWQTVLDVVYKVIPWMLTKHATVLYIHSCTYFFTIFCCQKRQGMKRLSFSDPEFTFKQLSP